MGHELVLSVTPQDCEVQTFSAGGKGGQHRDHANTAVRVIHHPSGARGEGRTERSQHQNLRLAFARMASTPEFLYWAHVQAGTRKSREQLLAEVDAELSDPTKVKIEFRGPNGWEEEYMDTRFRAYCDDCAWVAPTAWLEEENAQIDLGNHVREEHPVSNSGVREERR